MNSKLLMALLLATTLGACANKPASHVAPAAAGTTNSSSSAQVETANLRLLAQAAALVQAKKPAEALALAQSVVASFERLYRQDGVLSYSARSQIETLIYVLEGPKRSMSTVVHGPGWGLAYFMKGFALVDLQRLEEAKQAFDMAIELSPRNSKFLSERANIDVLERRWQASFDRFKEALDAAEMSPPDVKLSEFTRALRGMAFAQVELGDLKEAKALHERVLALDPDNAISKRELRFIEGRIHGTSGDSSLEGTPSPVTLPPADPRFSPQTQADELVTLWEQTCLKHYRNPLALRAALKGGQYIENPPHAASFLNGEPGVVWDASTSVYAQRILVLLDNGLCEVRSQRASSRYVENMFSRSVESLVEPGVTVRKLPQWEVPDYGGPLRKLVYRVENKADQRVWHFGAGTTDDSRATTQAVLAISPQGARLKKVLPRLPPAAVP